MKRLSILLSLCTAVTGLHAQTTLYTYDFSGGATTLNGTGNFAINATHGTGGNWVSNTDNLQNGTFVPNGATGAASLAFAPVDGYVYTLTMTGISATANNSWIGAGYGLGNDTASLAATGGGALWELSRPDNTGDDQVAHLNLTGGAGNIGGANIFSISGDPTTVTIELDTTDGTGGWDVTWLAFNGTTNQVLTTQTNIASSFETAIESIKFSTANGGSNGTLQNISLTVVPEPTTYALIFGALSLGVVLIRRRIKA